MFKWTSLVLMMVGFTVLVPAQEPLTMPQTKGRPSFESLIVGAGNYIAEKAEDVSRLELMVAETEARTRKTLHA